MPAVSVAQRRFGGDGQSSPEGEMSAPSKEIASAAKGMKKTDVKKFASTKEKELPMVKEYMIGYGAVVSSARPDLPVIVMRKESMLLRQRRKRKLSKKKHLL